MTATTSAALGVTDWLAIAAGGASLVSLFFAFRADQRAHRAEERAKRADEREERRERRDAAEAVARRRGKPVVMERGGAGGPTAPSITHDYAVRNVGQAAISELYLSIEDAEGNTVSAYDAGGQLAIVPGDAPVMMTVEVRQPLPEGPLTLMVEWTDPEGTEMESTGIYPRRHY